LHAPFTAVRVNAMEVDVSGLASPARNPNGGNAKKVL